MDMQPVTFDAPAGRPPAAGMATGPVAALAADVEPVGIRHYPGYGDFAAHGP